MLVGQSSSVNFRFRRVVWAASLALLAAIAIGCDQLVQIQPKSAAGRPQSRPTPLAGPDDQEHTMFRRPLEVVGEVAEPPRSKQHEGAIASAEDISQSFRDASRIVLPSVVTIQRTSPVERNGRSDSGDGEESPLDDFFRRFFGDTDNLTNRRQIALGSGVIIDSSGIVLTNAHVVGTGKGTVAVRLHDGRMFEAVDVKSDPKTDLAVLRIHGAGQLEAARLGNSDQLQIGDWVIAVGNPFGLSETVTAGIIGAKQRGLGITDQEGFLQTDAAINPGNSGGPLVNLRGQVVGIATAISTTTGGYQGIGFAIPINTARWASEQLITTGEVTRAYLGVGVQELTPDVASQLNLDRHAAGVLVTQVYPDSPAEEAGIRPKDVIASFAGHLIASPTELQSAVQQAAIGSQQQVTIIRNGDEKNLTVTVRKQPENVRQTRRLIPRE